MDLEVVVEVDLEVVVDTIKVPQRELQVIIIIRLYINIFLFRCLVNDISNRARNTDNSTITNNYSPSAEEPVLA